MSMKWGTPMCRLAKSTQTTPNFIFELVHGLDLDWFQMKNWQFHPSSRLGGNFRPLIDFRDASNVLRSDNLGRYLGDTW